MPERKSPAARKSSSPAAWLARGALIVLPVAATVYLFVAVVQALDGLVRNEKFYFPGLGLLASIGLLLAVGAAASTARLAERFFEWGGRRLERLPLLGTIFTTVRDTLGLFAEQKGKMGRVVVLRGEGGRESVVGFVTAEGLGALEGTPAAKGNPVPVYVPMSYQIGGFTFLVPRERLEPIDVPIDAAMRFVLTGGMGAAPPAAAGP